MTVASLIRALLELDQQCLTSRPSPWGQAAKLVATLAEHAEGAGGYRNPAAMAGWRNIDLSPVDRPAPRSLDQPTLDAIDPVPALTEACRAGVLAIHEAVNRPMGVKPESAYEALRKLEAAILLAGGRDLL